MAGVLRSVMTELGPISYTLERKRVKNLNLRVRPDGSVYVSAPGRVPLTYIDDFICRKAEFILEGQRRMAQRRPKPEEVPQYLSGDTLQILGQPVTLMVQAGKRDTAERCGDVLTLCLREPENRDRREKLVEKYLDGLCASVFAEVLQRLYPIFAPMGVQYPELRMRSMKSRWGSCMPGKGVITLNKRLIAYPVGVIDFVAMHEYCHFIHPNHSKDFYALLTACMPDWKQRKARLSQKETA